eukprot:1811146-Prymnesium_polylepis.2
MGVECLQHRTNLLDALQTGATLLSKIVLILVLSCELVLPDELLLVLLPLELVISRDLTSFRAHHVPEELQLSATYTVSVHAGRCIVPRTLRARAREGSTQLEASCQRRARTPSVAPIRARYSFSQRGESLGEQVKFQVVSTEADITLRLLDPERSALTDEP